MKKPGLAIHFIAIGGSLMHSLAISLKESGHLVTGSDDQVYEPSRSNLKKHGILPKSEGWHPSRISEKLDAVILGMHAKKDNPELLEAQKLGIKVYSAPEFIYEQSLDKQRIVIAGSHGKTTISSIIIHVLKHYKKEFDYAIGAHVDGFDNMVKLSNAPVIIIEGDEYPSSAIDLQPKILNYHHHIGLISGISWDHVNIYPTEEEYVKQFDVFADATPKGGTLIYSEEDALTEVIGSKVREDVHRLEFKTHPFEVENGKTYLLADGKRIPVMVFGRHNMSNMSAAMCVLQKLSISAEEFYRAITSYKGADQRLQLIGSNESSSIFKDFAHAPSKVLAATLAVKEQYPDRELVACLELHTYSSLNRSFLPYYKGGLKYANSSAVYYNPKTLEHKKLKFFSLEDIRNAFEDPHLKVFVDARDMVEWLQDQHWKSKNLLLMSSGTFDDLDFKSLSETILSK